MDPSLPAGTSGFGAALAQTLAALVGVCLAAWWLLRAAARREGAALTRGRVQVLERVPLDPRRSLLLVRVGRRAVLVGVGDQGMTALAEFRDDEIPAPAEPPPSGPGAFADVLARLRGTAKTKDAQSPDSETV